MSLEKEMSKLFPLIKGKRISVYGKRKTVWFTGTPVEWSGMYVTFKDWEHWNGDKMNYNHVHAKWIKRIEYV